MGEDETRTRRALVSLEPSRFEAIKAHAGKVSKQMKMKIRVSDLLYKWALEGMKKEKLEP